MRNLFTPRGASTQVYDIGPDVAVAVPKWTTLPTAASGVRGVAARTEGGASTADTYGIALKDRSDTYQTYYPLLSNRDNLTLQGIKRRVLNSSGNTTMTSAMSGAVMLLDAADVAYALPSLGSSADVGLEFLFLVTTAATGATITAGTGNYLIGGVDIVDFDTANTATPFFPNGSSHLTITLNGGTKGGKVGSWLRLLAVDTSGLGATRWFVSGTLYGDGVLATPFS